jgi:hypothetical protein
VVEARDVLDRCSLDTLLDGVETAADCALALSDGGCRAGPGTAPASAWPPTARPLVYVCGPTDFVETAASALVVLRPEAGRMARTLRRDRRFGMTRLDRNAIAGEPSGHPVLTCGSELQSEVCAECAGAVDHAWTGPVDDRDEFTHSHRSGRGTSTPPSGQ